MTQTRVNGSTQDIENFIREYLFDLDAGSKVICVNADFLSFTKQKIYDGKPPACSDVQWCYASLILEQDNTVSFVAALDPKGIMKLCDGDFFEYETRKDLYQNRLNYLSAALLKRFGKAESQAATKKPMKQNAQIYDRAMIWRELIVWMKATGIRPKPSECIAKLKEKPKYRAMKISRQRMQKILDEGFNGAYDKILNNV